MLNFLKNWTLPVAMLAGALGYFIFANFAFLEPTKPFMSSFIASLTPALIFAQLLLTFCKVQPHELMPSPWHGWLLLFQLVSTSLVAALLIFVHMDGAYKEVFEGAMVCLICPTATAAAVITGKLGGSASSLTTYTLLSNILAAIVVPLMFPLVEPHADITFMAAFLKILSKVFPLLLCPFFLAMLFRYFLPKLQHFLLGFRTCHRDGPDREVSCRKQCSGRSGGVDRLGGLGDLCCPVLFGQTDRDPLFRPHQCRTGPRPEKHRTCHLDGLYLSGSAFIGRPRILRPLAKYF